MDTLALALLIYALAILISLLVAVLIKGIVAVAEWLRRTAEPAVQAPAADAIACDDIAVIAAAVYALLGTQRIVHIEDVHRGQVWTASARASQYASRKPSRHSRH